MLDFHSGGKTLDFVPFAAAHVLEDKQQQAACVAAMQAFNAPYSIMLEEIDSVGMYGTAVENQGKVIVLTELGGGGSATARSSSIARRCVHNILVHAGILRAELEFTPSKMLDMSDENSALISFNDGLVDYHIDLEESVEIGDVVAQVWPVDRTGEAPIEYVANTSGILVGRHFPGLIKTGDFMALIANVIS